jgi:hypothetical protein
MTLNITTVQNDILGKLNGFEREVLEVYKTLVLQHWGGELHGFPYTLYGYMMTCFAHIDLLSAYWRGNDNGQTERMIAFMDTYISSNREANSLAVQVWRHKLMHTAEPRYLTNRTTGKVYKWLLHWREHLPIKQHYTFQETSSMKALNIGLMYLIEDIKRGAEKYLSELATSNQLQENYVRFQRALDSYTLRDY